MIQERSLVVLYNLDILLDKSAEKYRVADEVYPENGSLSSAQLSHPNGT